jgi:AcrR family transcriptional regulator
MSKKELQERRMKGYFIDAAKELLKGEGLSAVSVRSVADKAGYSYATLYNYFRDLNDLIFECVKDFQAECELAVQRKTSESGQGQDRIKATVLAYVQYFTEYSGIFELFFLERMSSIGNKKPVAESIYKFLDKLCEPHWEYCITQNLYDSVSAEKKKQQLRHCVMGMLLFYQNRFQPDNYKDFVELLTRKVEEIVSTG